MAACAITSGCPIALLSLAIAAVTVLGWYADRVTPLAFELLVILIGAGFGPVPSLTAVAMQNVVSRHQFGISIGAMNFSRNLYATMLIAVFGAIVLASAQTGGAMRGAAAATAQNAAQGFASVFFIAAASFAIALIAIVRLEEKPLRAGGEGDVE